LTTIRTPLSAEEGIARLGVIDQLVTAKGWERAAILATLIRLPGSGGNPDSRVYTAEQLAKEGISGLRDPDTIRKYVQRWLDANDGEYPEFGVKIKLPELRWPPVDPSDRGTRMSAKQVEKQVRESREIAEAAIRGLADGGLEHLDDDEVEELVHQASAARPAPAGRGHGRSVRDRTGDAPFDLPPRSHIGGHEDERRMNVHRDQANLAAAITRIKWDFDTPALRDHLELEVIQAAYDDLAEIIVALQGVHV